MKQKPWKISRTTLKAHWIDISDAATDDGGRDWHIRDLQCSNCGNMIRCYYKPFYCGACGARMVKNEIICCSGYKSEGEKGGAERTKVAELDKMPMIIKKHKGGAE